MPEICFNGQRHPLPEPFITLEHWLMQTREQQPDAPFAVALNGQFVPRREHARTVLRNGDQLDLIAPVGGG